MYCRTSVGSGLCPTFPGTEKVQTAASLRSSNVWLEISVSAFLANERRSQIRGYRAAAFLLVRLAGVSTAPIDLDVTLRRFARQAQSLTLAGGASIALSSDLPGSGDEMTCRASAGKAAPLVGARLRLVPGLKRECLREGK